MTPSRRYNLPAVSAFLRLTHYRLVNWAHMLAGGLASAVKEYVRKFSGGTADAVVNPNTEVVPSPEREFQELSSNSPEQPPRKEPRVERTPPRDGQGQEDVPPPKTKETTDEDAPIAFKHRRVESRLRKATLTIGESREDQPVERQEPPRTQGQAVSTLEPPRRFWLLAETAAQGKRPKRCLCRRPLNKRKRRRRLVCQAKQEDHRHNRPFNHQANKGNNASGHRKPLRRTDQTSDHVTPTRRSGDSTPSCLYNPGHLPRPRQALLNRSR
ncbi:hypothetical protein R1flu_012245 [Riccia fluitans]|uniref:Uncharacterized protein n=1 Tax=Riccia fluitans TaxID=41844 RepID=A0ABD1ZB79_9MARC